MRKIYKLFLSKQQHEELIHGYCTKTDEQGIATINFGAPGVWVIYCKHEVPTPGDAKAEFSNYRGYMMLEVKAEQAKK